ncbi:HAUS2 protein, partial [Eubucco bourcierii]|nr:HAUS2 protein [Eubucco bourcierii]
TLDLTCRKTPCFAKFREMEKKASMQAEIDEVQPVLLSVTIDSTLHFHFVGKKCKMLQDMNRHLEAVLKNEKALKKRLLKPRCQDSLPIEATFHKYIAQLLTEAVTFIEKFENHLQAVRTIPQMPNMMQDMDTALAKTEVLTMELEKLVDQIMKWRDMQKQLYSD